jgi:cell fate regulator YaaT (PSP1 superfamily)
MCGKITTMTQNIVGIRFQKFGKIYHFSAVESVRAQPGDYVVVETSRGKQLGEVVQTLDDASKKRNGSLKPILRMATPRDLVLRQVWEYKEKEAVETCRSKLKELNIIGVKIIDAEFTFDGKRLTFLYNSEGDENIDLSNLREGLKGLYRRTRIDIRKIGPRDVAKKLGGMGACGMSNRCCSKFLIEFNPISIRMAKAQSVSLAPSEITGMCGRLRCCLAYEYDHYVEARKELPREKKRINTPMGDGKVLSVSPLMRTILIDLGEGGLKEFTLEELQNQDDIIDVPNQRKTPEVQNPRRGNRKRGSSRRKRNK